MVVPANSAANAAAAAGASAGAGAAAGGFGAALGAALVKSIPALIGAIGKAVTDIIALDYNGQATSPEAFNANVSSSYLNPPNSAEDAEKVKEVAGLNEAKQKDIKLNQDQVKDLQSKARDVITSEAELGSAAKASIFDKINSIKSPANGTAQLNGIIAQAKKDNAQYGEDVGLAKVHDHLSKKEKLSDEEKDVLNSISIHEHKYTDKEGKSKKVRLGIPKTYELVKKAQAKKEAKVELSANEAKLIAYNQKLSKAKSTLIVAKAKAGLPSAKAALEKLSASGGKAAPPAPISSGTKDLRTNQESGKKVNVVSPKSHMIASADIPRTRSIA